MEYALALQRLVALVVVAVVVAPLVRVVRPSGAPPVPRSLAAFAAVIGCGFGLVALAQVVWSVAPDLSRGYRANSGLNARAWRLRSPQDRRTLADRAGTPLVVNLTVDGHVARRHVFGGATAHVLGYHHPRFGQTGAEAACNGQLATWRRPAWDILGSLGQPGNPLAAPLRLTLDLRLQQAAAQALGDRRGAVAAVDPQTGEVLALVSSPTFDPDALDAGSFARIAADPGKPLLNRALHGLYPPGSTFKAVTAAAALAAGYTADTTLELPSEGWTAPGDSQPIRDHELAEAQRAGHAWSGHGALDLRGAMAVSANGFFACLGCQVGGEALLDAARAFGLDQSWPLVDAPDEANDLSAHAAQLPTDLGRPANVARLAIGQDELLVTPLHMALVAAAVAANGSLHAPRLVAGQVGTVRQVMTVPIAKTVGGLMRCAVTDPRGTCRGLRGEVPVAAKTGSAENTGGEPHAWTIAFAPYGRTPRLAVAVVVEHGGAGSKAALPVARAVIAAAALESAP